MKVGDLVSWKTNTNIYVGGELKHSVNAGDVGMIVSLSKEWGETCYNILWEGKTMLSLSSFNIKLVKEAA